MHEEIAANKRKTVLLVVGAFVFFGLVGMALGYVFGTGPIGLVVALVVAAVLSVSSYLYGDRLVLASSRAREVSAADEPRLHNLVEGLAIAAGVPKPRIYVVPEQAPNAFATGRDPEHASIAVTQGLLSTMNRVELEGVIGHELAHVLDRDMLLGTIVATLVGAVVLMSEFLMRSWLWGGLGGRRGNDSNGGPATLILFGIGFALMVIAPIAGEIIKRAVSRNREFLADAQGAMLTRYPPGPRRGAAEDRRVADRDALGQQRHRAPLALAALAHRGREARSDGEDLRHAPADRRAHPAVGGDVTFVSNSAQVFGTPRIPGLGSLGRVRGPAPIFDSDVDPVHISRRSPHRGSHLSRQGTRRRRRGRRRARRRHGGARALGQRPCIRHEALDRLPATRRPPGQPAPSPARPCPATSNRPTGRCSP